MSCCSVRDVLSYSTPKTVIIRDKLLGFLRLLFVCPIIVYLVYAVIIDGKYYMREDVPTGAVFSKLVRPPALDIDFDALTYCEQSSLPTLTFPLDCAHMDALDASLNSVGDNNIFATTRFRSADETLSADCTDKVCTTPWEVNAGGLTPYQYVAGVEDFEVELVHYAQGSRIYYSTGDEGKYTIRSTSGVGSLRNAAGAVLQEFPATGIADAVSLRLLLTAAGMTSIDVRCDSNLCSTSSDVSIRGDGIALVVFIKYSNVANLQAAPTYEYLPYRIPREGFVASEVLPRKLSDLTRTVQERNAIRVTFVQVGTIGRFEFPLLFVHVASVVALILLSILVIDLLMLYVVPRSRFYRLVKYEKEVDFEQVQDKYEKLSQNIKGTLLSRHDRERLALQIAADELVCDVPPIEDEIVNDPELNDRKAEELRIRLLSGGAAGGARRELSNDELEAVFDIVDADDNKQLEFDEVKRAFELMGMPQTDAQILKIMRKLDLNGNGVVDKDEFLLLCKSFPIDFSTRARILIRQHEIDYADEAARDVEFMRGHFEDLDADRDGRLTYDQMHRFLNDEGIKLSPVEFKVLMQKVDVDGDLTIVFDEFMSLHTMLKAAMERKDIGGAEDFALYGSAAGASADKTGNGTVNAAGAVVPSGGPGGVPGAAASGAAAANGAVRVGGSVQNRLNSVNWQGVKTQFRALTNYINGLRDELRELTLIVRMLQRRVIPQTLENVTEHEPVHLAGDWSGEVSEECRLT
mgnify:CR=1 FL=1